MLEYPDHRIPHTLQSICDKLFQTKAMLSGSEILNIYIDIKIISIQLESMCRIFQDTDNHGSPLQRKLFKKTIVLLLFSSFYILSSIYTSLLGKLFYNSFCPSYHLYILRVSNLRTTFLILCVPEFNPIHKSSILSIY